MGKFDQELTAFQRAKQRFGLSHPAEQVLALLDRVEALENRDHQVRPESPSNVIPATNKMTVAERMAKAREARGKVKA